MPQGQLPKGSSGSFKAVLKDDATSAIPGTSITSLTYTIRDRRTGSIVNGRNNTALSPASTYVDSNGNLNISLTDVDNDFVTAGQVKETHRIIVKYTYTGGLKGVLWEDYEVVDPDVV